MTSLRAVHSFCRQQPSGAASVPASMSGVSHRNCDETHQTLQQGRQALAHPGRHSLAALAVGRQRTLLPSRHIASAVLACVWPAGSVSSSVAVVAAVGVQLPVSYWLVAPIAPLSYLRARTATDGDDGNVP